MFKRPLETMRNLTNVIISNRCYVHADSRGMIFRFVVDEEIAPPILVDEQLASQLHGMIGDFLKAKQQEREQQNAASTIQPAE